MEPQHQTALRISLVNSLLNTFLAVAKLTVGLLSGSNALVSDGVHSVVDVASSVVVMIGVRLSARRSDREHPYGHERMECVAAVLLAVLVGVTGIGIGVSGVRSVLNAGQASSSPPGAVALTVAVLSVAVKEIMFRYTRRAATKSRSDALLADAWHLRSDALSSLGGLIGVLGANLGLSVLDPLAAVVISLFIMKAAISIFADAMRKMTDRACDRELEQSIRACIIEYAMIKGIEQFKTRLFGSRVLCEVTVTVDGSLSCREAYDVAREVESRVRTHFECVKDCAVHIRPI